MKFFRIAAIGPLLTLVLCAGILLGGPSWAETNLRMGLASLPNDNGNPFTSSARTAAYTYRAMFDTLTQLSSNLVIEPGLAVSWEASGDTTWIVHLREGVTFSNGEPFDAEAALFSFRYLQSDEGAGESLSRDVKDIVGMEVVDPLTLRFETAMPIPEFPRLLSVIWMVPPAHWQALGRGAFSLDPLGTGPFRVREWNPTQLLFDANTESWRPPKIDALEIMVLPEMSSRIAALVTDRIDVASEIGPDDIFTIEAAGLKIYQRPATASQMIVFNTLIESPLQDARVRQALNYAVNKQAIALAIMGGRTAVVDQMTAGINPERHPELEPYPYDPDKARLLLAEAGYPDGFSFVFEFSFGTAGNHMPSMYQQVAADLSQVGVHMEVQPRPWSQYVQGILLGKWSGQAFGFEYELLPTGNSMRPFRLHSCAWPYPWYCDETIQPAIELAKHSTNEDERKAAVHTVLAHYHEQAAALMLVENMGLDGVNPRVRGYHQEGGIIPYHNISLAE